MVNILDGIFIVESNTLNTIENIKTNNALGPDKIFLRILKRKVRHKIILSQQMENIT